MTSVEPENKHLCTVLVARQQHWRKPGYPRDGSATSAPSAHKILSQSSSYLCLWASNSKATSEPCLKATFPWNPLHFPRDTGKCSVLRVPRPSVQAPLQQWTFHPRCLWVTVNW